MTLIPAHMQREINSGRKDIERERIRLTRQLDSTMAKIERDPISALNLRHVPRKGILCDPISIKGKWCFLRLNPGLAYAPSGSGVKWTPAKYERAGTTIQPLQVVTSPWGLIIAFKVAHKDLDFRLPLNWFNRSDPASGSVYLVDPVGHQYLYLTASTLRGEVVARVPRTGLLVFQNPESATDRLQVHFSSVRISNAPHGLSSFSLECTGATLRNHLKNLKSSRTVAAEVLGEVDRHLAKARQDLVKDVAGPLRHFINF